MGRGDDHAGGTVGHERVGGLGDRAGGVDHVVDEHAPAALDLTDDAVGDHLVGAVDVAGLVDEGQGHPAELTGPLLGDLDPAGVRGDDGELAVAVLLLDVVGENRPGHEVVDRPVEEALDLVGVQVDRDEPVGAGRLEHVGDEPGGDRLAAAVLLVLAGVPVEGQDGGDPLGASALERVHHEQLLHDRLVDRRGVALQHEGIAPPHRLLVAHVDLTVGELVRARGHQRRPELAGDVLGEVGVGASREDHEVLLGGPVDAGHWVSSLLSGVVSDEGEVVATSAVAVPGRCRATQPSMLRWRPRATASCPEPTPSVTAEPAAT